MQEVDLSQLKIQRDPEQPRGPRTKRGLLPLLAGGGILVLVGAIVLLSGVLSSPATIRVGTVSLLFPSQARSVLTASGYVVAQRKAAVASKATGRLIYLGVEEGDRIKKGQIIARIESQDVEAALAQAVANNELARATLEQAKAEHYDASMTYDRQKALLEAKLISQSEFDAAEARKKSVDAGVDAAEANVKATQAAVNAAEVGVEYTRIRAPFDGTVLAKNADVGEVVAPFAAGANSRAAVVTVADMSSLEVEADVSESNIERISLGMPCEIALDAYPEVRYGGVVHKIVPTADRAKATVLTKVRFLDRDARVLPEMSAKVNFLSEPLSKEASSAPKVAIPATAVISRGGRQIVFLVNEGTVLEREVKVGEELGSQLAILSGLAPGDRIVIDPPAGLESGTEIQLAQ